jgi:hypothetical protein
MPESDPLAIPFTGGLLKTFLPVLTMGALFRFHPFSLRFAMRHDFARMNSLFTARQIRHFAPGIAVENTP